MNVHFWTQVKPLPSKICTTEEVYYRTQTTVKTRNIYELSGENYTDKDRESQSLFAVLKYPQIDSVIRYNSFKSLASLQLVEIYEISQLFPGVLKWNYARILFLQASLITSGKDS